MSARHRQAKAQLLVYRDQLNHANELLRAFSRAQDDLRQSYSCKPTDR